MTDNTKLNVLFMGNFPYPEGMAGTKRIQHFVDAVAESGNYVELLLLRQGGKAIKRDEVQEKGVHKGIQFRTIGKNLKLDAKLPLNFITYLFQGYNKLKSFRKGKKNILFYYGSINLDNIFFVLVAYFFNYKIIFDIVEDYDFDSGKVSFARQINISIIKLLDNLNLKWGHGLVVISTHLKKKYDERNKTDKPVVLIPIAAELGGEPTKKEFNDPIRIVYAGSFAAKDGLRHLIEAVQQLDKRFNVVLDLIGKGRDANTYKETYGHLERINFVGFLDDESFYSSLRIGDILCVPRTGSGFSHAGFPFKLGEYLATGNPVVTSDTGDVAHYLKHKEDALIIEPGSTEALLEAFNFLLSNPVKAMEMGRKGREACKKHFDKTKNNEILLSLMKEISNK